MKALLIVIIASSMLQARAQGQVEVTVRNVKDGAGKVRVGIFKDAGSFLKEPFVGRIVSATKGELVVVFDQVPAGTYAISIIHDENENGELDSNMVGMPKEGFGFSNDAMGMFGPPSFEKASLKLGTEPASVSIAMRYL